LIANTHIQFENQGDDDDDMEDGTMERTMGVSPTTRSIFEYIDANRKKKICTFWNGWI